MASSVRLFESDLIGSQGSWLAVRVPNQGPVFRDVHWGPSGLDIVGPTGQFAWNEALLFVRGPSLIFAGSQELGRDVLNNGAMCRTCCPALSPAWPTSTICS